jgi:hypothetical protein
MSLRMSLVAAGLLAAAPGVARAACAITMSMPTGTVPTTAVGQTFTFVATDDCTTLSWVGQNGVVSKMPRRGMAVGTTRHRYSVMLTSAEFELLLDPMYDTLTWRVTGRDAMGAFTRVTTTNEIDVDHDGWTRTAGDAGECDAAADQNPGENEVCGNAIDEDCDGVVDECAFGDPEAVVTTDQMSYLGVARGMSAGDVNGDGTDDLVLSSSIAFAGRGVVYIVPGPLTGTIDVADQVALLPGMSRLDSLGDMHVTGDVDLDGIDDVLTGTTSRNGVYLFFGPITADRRVTAADVWFAGPSSSLTGEAVGILPDFDGDGAPDVVAGNGAGDGGGRMDAGIVYVTSIGSSATSDLETSSTYQFYGATRGDFLGRTVIDIGDATGDGIGDLALPVQYGDDPSVVYFMEGGATPGAYEVDDAAWASTTAPDSIGLQNDVAAGDYDGDGTTDLIVSDFYAQSSEGVDMAGVVSAFLGPVSGMFPSSDAATRWEGTAAASTVGSAVTAGDIDGDGQLDVLMGSPTPDDLTGAAYIQFGFASGTFSVEDLMAIPGLAPNGEFGSEAGVLLADWTGDGVPELALSAWTVDDYHGAVYLYESDGRY